MSSCVIFFSFAQPSFRHQPAWPAGLIHRAVRGHRSIAAVGRRRGRPQQQGASLTCTLTRRRGAPFFTPPLRVNGRQSQPCGAGRKFGSSGAGVRGRLCVVEIRKNLCKLSHEKTWSYCEFPIGNRSRLHLTSLQCSELTVSRLPCPSRVTASSNFLSLLRQAPACCDGRRTLAQHSTAAAPAWPAVARRGSRRCPTCGAHESCLPRRKARRRCQWSPCSVRRWWPAR